MTESSAPPRLVAERMPVTPWMRALAWGILSFLGYVATVMFLVWPISQLEQATGLPHPVTLGAWALTWVLGGGLLALAAARLVFGAWLEVRPTAWLILLGGAVVSGATASILADWTIGRYGFNESDLVGPMSLLWGVIAGVAVAGLGVQVAPRSAAWAPVILAIGGVALAISIIATNVPGLADGIGRDSWPLAGATIAATLYIGAVGVLSLARLRRT